MPKGYRKRRLRHRARPGAPRQGFKLDPRITAVILCLLFSVIFAVILGNYLGDKVDPDLDVYTPPTGVAPGDLSVIRASYLRTDDLTDANILALLEKRLDGADDVCLSLCDADGTLRYYSKLAASFGLSVGTALNLSGVLEHIAREDRVLCGTMTLTAFTESDPGRRAVILTFEEELICEIATAGIDEIVLLGLPTEAERQNETIAFLEGMRGRLGEVRLAVVLDPVTCLASENKAFLSRLSSLCGSLVLDLRAAELTQALEEVGTLLTRYRMRVLIAGQPTGDAVARIEEAAPAGWIAAGD